MVIIKVNYQVHPETLAQLRASVRKQAETGVVTVPPFCELLAEVPDGTEVEVLAHRSDSGDCNPGCARYPTCEYNHGRHGIVRINCPLWRAKG